MWDRDRRSMTLRAKHPLVYYLESNKRMLNYRNVRRRAEERVCARKAREMRQADLRAQSQEREQRERRMAAGTLVVRQRTLVECMKKRRVIHDTDSDEEEEARYIRVEHCVHPAVPALDAATAASAAAAATAAAATASAPAAPAVAVAPSALPGSDVLLPAAGAVHAAATSSTLDADWLQRAGAAAKRQAKPTQRRQQKKPKRKVKQKIQMTALIGSKRQRNGGGVAETQVATEDEDDEGAIGSDSGNRQGSDRHNRVGEDRQDGDIQGDESEGNSRATRRQRLGGGGKAGVLT